VAKLSVNQTLLKVKSHIKNGEITDAKKLYEIILQEFPNNKSAQQGLANLLKAQQNNITKNLPKVILSQLIELYNQGQLLSVVQKAQKIIKTYPENFILWNLLGAANKGLGKNLEASRAFKRVTELNPNYEGGYSNLGVTLQEQGKLEDAMIAYKKALLLKPNYAEAYNNMGNTLKDQGKLEEALNAYNKSLSLKPNYADAYFNMGVVLNEQGKHYEATLAYSKAISFDSDYYQAYNNIGNSYRELESPSDAIQAYCKAIALKPDYVEAHNNLGITYQTQNNLDEAIKAYNAAIKYRVDYSEAWINGADALEKWNKLDQLGEWLDKAVENFDIIPSDIMYLKSKLLWRNKEQNEALKLISTIAIEGISKNRKQGFLNLKAKCFEFSKKYTKAFEYFEEMNSLAKKSEAYFNSNSEKFFENIKNQLEQLKFKAGDKIVDKVVNDKNINPVFLVGFPRSGTTLMDTILRSHSSIEVLEEKGTVLAAKTLIRKNGYNDIQDKYFSNDILIEARSAYLREFAKYIKDLNSKTVYIDKLPLNLLEVPLIHQLFPDAKFILALRHPFDTILSCWMQDFEINAAMANMVDLDRIVDLYCIAMETFQICISKYGLNVHRIRYEDLLEDFKGESSALLKFLDLKWETKMEDYRSTALQRGRINTPSYSQVSQPIYKEAKYRWVKYREYLDKYSERIEPWIQEFEYLKN